jgi:TRAP-type mannitol/chloroaromatic compound transport system permease small subunit
MQALLRISGGIDRLNRGLSRAVAWLLLVMVVVGAYNAVARYLERDLGLRLSSNALLELQWYLFGLAFLLGAPHALRRGDHVRVDVIYGGLPARGRLWIDLLGGILFLIPFCAFAVWISRGFVVDSWVGREMSNDPGGLPRWPLKPFIPLAFALLGLQGLSEVVKRIAVLRGLATAAELGLDEAHGAPDEEGTI